MVARLLHLGSLSPAFRRLLFLDLLREAFYLCIAAAIRRFRCVRSSFLLFFMLFLLGELIGKTLNLSFYVASASGLKLVGAFKAQSSEMLLGVVVICRDGSRGEMDIE